MHGHDEQRIAIRAPATLAAVYLEDLASGAILAICIPKFYDESSCLAIQLRVQNSAQTRYAVAPSVAKVGMALFEATDDHLLEAYYADAEGAAARSAVLYDEHEDPIGRIGAILDSIWPAGCRIERLHDRPMYAGLVRVIDAGAELRPHQDNTHWDMPASPRAQTMLTQFSCNVYFAVPEDGGELELWDFSIGDEPSYRRMQVAGDYALARPAIGAPALVLRPATGDLIIFDARRVHAVAKVKRGIRSNASTFIALRESHEPLTLFS